MNKHETLNMNHETLGNELLSPHFKLSEFTASKTASDHGIANVPPPEAVENLRRLCQGCLEPLREALQLPVVITSGYRCQRLNELLVHAARKSQHMEGRAADFYISSAGFRFQDAGFRFQDSGSKAQVPSHRELLIKAFRLIITSPEIDFDQLILYPNFIHVSYVSKEKNRRGILLARRDGKLGYGRCTIATALQIV